MEKCPVCTRKVALVAQPCRCAQRFCAHHRMPEAHACTYDYKEEGRKQLGEAWVPRAPQIHGVGGGARA